jgi:hypothetical protein
MRKVAFAGLAATIAAVGIAVPASAIDGKQDMSIKLSSTKSGTKAKPKNVGLKVTTTLKPAATDKNFATTKAVLFFDKNLVFNGAKFKSCTAAAVQQSEASCPSGSKIGTGSAQGSALGITQNLKVAAFNGPKGKSLLLHVTGSAPLAIDSVMEAKLSKASGKYGYKLTVPIPANLQQPIPGTYATLLSFITNVKGTASGAPYVGLAGCTKKKLNFGGTFTFTDGTSQKVTTTSKCS